jgi:hypothetical protein
MRAPTFLLLFAGVLCSACGDLTLVESAKLSFKAPVDTNIVLTEAEQDTRNIMAFDVGNLVINTPNPSVWGAPTNHSFVGAASTVLHQRRENDLFPVLVAWVDGNNQINITFGNSTTKLFSPGFVLAETTPYQPALLGFQNKRYLLWWRSPELKIGEYQGQGVLAGVRTIFSGSDFGNIQGAFQPSATELNRQVFVLDQLGARSRGDRELHIARSTNLVDWQHSFVTLERPIAPRPVIVAFKNKLFIFYASTTPNNTIKYLSSDDGITWSDEFDLLVESSVDDSARAGVSGGMGAARHFDKLVVAWVTDQHSTSRDDVLVSVYR